MNKSGSNSAAATQAKAEKELMEEKKTTAVKTGAQKKPKKN